MANFDIELVGKIGSMALIDRTYQDLNYNIIARLSRELHPGCIWVTSGAVEIGRLDYLKRNGKLLSGTDEENKTDYAAQGQSILMQTYRQFIDSRYSVRQILVEHHHFNDPEKREQILNLLLRCPSQNAIPIINYNDCVSVAENRRHELQELEARGMEVHECVDNDETASLVASLVKCKTLLILSSMDGIFTDFTDKSTLVKSIGGKDVYELIANVEAMQKFCQGASRPGANGAYAKLEYIKEPAKNGTTVIIANSKYTIKDILAGTVPCTRIGL